MELSILIPARNEMFLKHTIEDILKNMRGETEILAVLDGAWAEPPVADHELVTLVRLGQPIGQRAATNLAASLSHARYVMKVDAHCAFDEGFDVKMIEAMQPGWTMAPVMRNLHVFDWVCKNGHRRYQGPSGDCKECGEPTVMEIVWIAKPSPQSTAYCFDSTPHFQYFNEFKKRAEGQGELTETMSLQGSCFMLEREKYWELNICDEDFGIWGSQGIEVAVKTWLSGGRVMVNHHTWYAHMFRTQGGDFGFPYPLSGKQVEGAKAKAKEQFFDGKWAGAVKPLSWLVKKFWPVPGWTEEDLIRLDPHGDTLPGRETLPLLPEGEGINKGIVYYTDNRLDEKIMTACQNQLKKAGLEIVSVSLKPLDFGRNIVLNGERAYLTMFKQILAGLEASTAEIIFFAEHDVLYHPNHFEFTPAKQDVFYYNENVFKVDRATGKALFYYVRQTSGLCAYRDLLIEHYRKRIEIVEKTGYNRKMGFEPGTHRRQERVDDYRAESWMSVYPNIDIRHDKNLTPSRWRKEQFRDQRYTRGWLETDQVPGWGKTLGRFEAILEDLWQPI